MGVTQARGDRADPPLADGMLERANDSIEGSMAQACPYEPNLRALERGEERLSGDEEVEARGFRGVFLGRRFLCELHVLEEWVRA
jgi:hypothetical protein